MKHTIYTIGHSTHPITEFIAMLHAYAVTQLVDIRTIPKSRHNPQFGQEQLKESLEASGITYHYLKSLGGLRPKRPHSINDAWRNASFRNYADYMQTDEFKQGVDDLIALSHKHPTAIMCSEAVPWRCHRSLVGDALLVRDITVCDIFSATSVKPHTLTSFAVVDGTDITYPKSALQDDET